MPLVDDITLVEGMPVSIQVVAGKYGDEKSPAGKTDYHTMGACYEVLNALSASDIKR